MALYKKAGMLIYKVQECNYKTTPYKVVLHKLKIEETARREEHPSTRPHYQYFRE